MSKRNDQSARYLEQFSAERSRLPGAENLWLEGIRGGAIERFAAEGFPTTRSEAWKYTNLSRMTRTMFGPAGPAGTVTASDLAPLVPAGAEFHRIVFVNGRYAPGVSELGALPDGVALEPLAQLLDGDSARLRALLERVPAGEGTALADLNTAFMADGLVLTLGKGVVLDKPLHLIHYADPGAEHGAAHTRNLIVAEPGSEATLVESYGGRHGAYWTNAVTQIAVGDGARLRHVRLQQEAEDAFHTALVTVALARDAGYEAFYFAEGAALARSDVRVAIDGPGAECRLNGVSLLRGRQHVDNTTEIDHRVPHGTSNQVFKNVLDGQARSVFQGRIIVREDAQQTAADQQNRNLLLSDRAQADAKPELQIHADDVKCSHGATVGDLDREALFYLLSRGIVPDQARALLVVAFVSEALETIGDETVRRHLQGEMARWLGTELEEELAA